MIVTTIEVHNTITESSEKDQEVQAIAAILIKIINQESTRKNVSFMMTAESKKIKI